MLLLRNSKGKEFPLRKHSPAEVWGNWLGGNDRCLLVGSIIQGVVPWIFGVLPEPIEQVSIGKKAGQ